MIRTKDIMKLAVSFLESAEKEIVLVRFTKKDGTIRDMKCTVNFNIIPPNKRPKEVNFKKVLQQLVKNKILHLFDVEKQEWRSVPLDKVLLLQVKDKVLFERRV